MGELFHVKQFGGEPCTLFHVEQLGIYSLFTFFSLTRQASRDIIKKMMGFCAVFACFGAFFDRLGAKIGI